MRWTVSADGVPPATCACGHPRCRRYRTAPVREAGYLNPAPDRRDGGKGSAARSCFTKTKAICSLRWILLLYTSAAGLPWRPFRCRGRLFMRAAGYQRCYLLLEHGEIPYRRDYASPTTIRIRVYDDRIMIWNAVQSPPEWTTSNRLGNFHRLTRGLLMHSSVREDRLAPTWHPAVSSTYGRQATPRRSQGRPGAGGLWLRFPYSIAIPPMPLSAWAAPDYWYREDELEPTRRCLRPWFTPAGSTTTLNCDWAAPSGMSHEATGLMGESLQRPWPRATHSAVETRKRCS